MNKILIGKKAIITGANQGLGLEIAVATRPVLGERLLRRDPEDPPSVLVEHDVATDITVVPVQYVHVAARPDLHAEADPLGVVGK